MQFPPSVTLDLLVLGPFTGYGAYKNVIATTPGDGSCDGQPVAGFTMVLANSELEAVASCQTGPDPAATAATQLSAVYSQFEANAWACENGLGSSVLFAGACYSGTTQVDIGFEGPRNTLNNGAVYNSIGGVCTGPSLAVTLVQQSTSAAALALCQSISPAFDLAAWIVPVEWTTAPAYTYMCQDAA